MSDKHEPIKLACECHNWATLNLNLMILTGHHETCGKKPSDISCALKLIKRLTKGIENWAADEDGVPPALWEDYKFAKAVLGELHEVKEA